VQGIFLCRFLFCSTRQFGVLLGGGLDPLGSHLCCQINKDGTISLVTQHSETSKNVFEELKKFKLLLQPYPNSRITFIEIPHYSLTKWNIHAKTPLLSDSMTGLKILFPTVGDLWVCI
jgi:hypothetical protein